MPQKPSAALQDWIDTVLKSVTIALISLGCFVFNNLNNGLKDMAAHQVDSDKRILAIEVSRDTRMASYDRLLQDVSEMKQTMVQLTMRIQTIADFMASSFTKKPQR